LDKNNNKAALVNKILLQDHQLLVELIYQEIKFIHKDKTVKVKIVRHNHKVVQVTIKIANHNHKVARVTVIAASNNHKAVQPKVAQDNYKVVQVHKQVLQV